MRARRSPGSRRPSSTTTRARILAALGALGLIGASVFGASLSAAAGPANAPVIDTPVSGPDADDQPQVEGSVTEDGLTVTVAVTNSLGTSVYCVDAAATIALGFSCLGAPLPYGTNTFVATSTYTSGIPDTLPSPASNAVGYEHYDPVTPVAVLTAPPPAGTDATVTFTGTGPALGTVRLTDPIVGEFCVTTVADDGSWTCQSVLAVGSYQADADATPLGAGTPSNDGGYLFDIVTPAAPAVDVVGAPPPWITGSTQPSVDGDKDLGVTAIEVRVSTDNFATTDDSYCTVSAATGATIWNCSTPNGAELVLGMNYLRAVAFNANGDASAPSPIIQVERVVVATITGPADGTFTNDDTPAFSGTGEGALARVYSFDLPVGFPWSNAFCQSAIAGNNWSCFPAQAVPDGQYQYFAYTDIPGTGSTLRTITVDTVAPAGPLISGPTTTTDPRPVITGTAEPFAAITVYRDGAVAACQQGSVTADAAGNWACTLSAALAVGGTFSFGAVQADRAGNLSAAGVPPMQLSVTVVPPPVAASAAPPPVVFAAWVFDFATSGNQFRPGDTARLTGSGLPAGALVDVEFHSTPVKVGATTVSPEGAFDVLVRIPEDAEPGAHRFVVTVTPFEGLPSTQERPVTVVLPVKAIQAPVQTTPLAAPDAGELVVDRSDPAAPSSLTGTIKTIADILANPLIIGTAVLSGFALLLFVALPAELLNSTLSEQYPRIARRMPKLTIAQRLSGWLERAPIAGALAVTLAAAIIFGFADPGFGFDATSLRVVLACAIALFIVGYLASAIAGFAIRGRWRLETEIELKPLGLVLAALGVIASRLLDFSPGFLIGLLLGIGLVGSTTARQRAKATLLQAGVVFALAMSGWVGYSILAAAGSSENFATALALDTLVAITTEGLTALFIGLLPFKLLNGATIFEHSKLAWALAYSVAATAFVLIVVPTAWGEVDGQLWLWIAVVGGFAVVAVGLYLYFRFLAVPVEDVALRPAQEPAEVAGYPDTHG